MFTFTGNTTQSVTSSPKKLPTLLESFSLVNKTNGSITFNVYKLTTGGGQYSITPLNQSLSASQMWENDRPVVLLATEQIRIQTSGSIDYDFSFSNIKAE